MYNSTEMFSTEGEQNRSPPNIPLQHVNCFELKSVKAQKTQEELFITPTPPPPCPLNILKEFSQRAWSRKRAVIRDNCRVWVRCGGLDQLGRSFCSNSSLSHTVSGWHSKHLFTKYLFFPFSCALSSFPLKSKTPTPFLLNSGWHTSLNCLFLTFSCLCEAPIYTKLNLFSPLNLSDVSLIIRPDKRTQEGRGKF